MRQLLFVEANTTGTGMLALRAAHRHGWQPVFLTARSDRYAGLPDTPATVVDCDTDSMPAMRQAIAALPAGPPAGITTTSEFYLPAVATLAAELGLPGNDAEVVRTCRNKAAVRRALQARGLDQPLFAEVRATADVDRAISAVGLPCVVKPVDDSGSENVRVCRTAGEVLEQVDRVLAVRFNVRGQPTAGTALVEEYVDGPEFSVEMFGLGDRTECIGITRKTLTDPPFCVETGHLFPAPVRAGVAAELEDLVRRVLATLGVHRGPTHTEVRYGPRGPMLVELNCRLAGGMIPELVRLARGIDLLDAQVQLAAGATPALTASRSAYAGIRFLLADRPGTLTEIEGTTELRHPAIAEVRVTARPGQQVRPVRNAYDRLGFVIAAAPTAAEVRVALARVDAVRVVLD